MARKQLHKVKKHHSAHAEPGTLLFYLEPYLEYRRVRHYAQDTVKHDERFVLLFIYWASERGVEKAEDATRNVLEAYQRHLYHHRKKNGEPLSIKTQLTRLMAIRAFFKWLAKEWHVPYNPAADLELPKRPKSLPRHVLTVEEVENVLRLPDINETVGLRDRAILELLYSTGMRRTELTLVKLFDLDLDGRTVFVQGKGKKDRVVPVGRRAIAWLDKYIREARPKLVVEPDCGYLFLTVVGEYIAPGHLGDFVMKYVQASGTEKKGACHLFRHTCATLMLEGGADVRYVQYMLGHSQLSTTQIYTHVSIRKLKEVHERCHPAQVERKRKPPAEGE
jgi:integrase/recombinase XerD